MSSRILELACFPRTRASRQLSRPCRVRHPRWRPRTLARRARFERHACRAPLSSSTGKARRYQKTRTRWVAHASATVSGDAIQKAAARLAAHGASAAASWWAEPPHARGSGLNASAISSSQNRMCCCSTVRSVRGAGQQMAPARRGMRRMGGSRRAGVAPWYTPTGLMIGEHHPSSVGEYCACSHVS